MGEDTSHMADANIKMRLNKRGIAASTLLGIIIMVVGFMLITGLLTDILAKTDDRTALAACRGSHAIRQTAKLMLDDTSEKTAIEGTILGVPVVKVKTTPGGTAAKDIPLLCKSIELDIKPKGKDVDEEKESVLNQILEDSVDVWWEHLEGTQSNMFFKERVKEKKSCFIGIIDYIKEGKHFKDDEEISSTALLEAFEKKTWKTVQITDGCYGGRGVCIPDDIDCGDHTDTSKSSYEKTRATDFYNDVQSYDSRAKEYKHVYEFFSGNQKKPDMGTCPDDRPVCCIAKNPCLDRGGVCVKKNENNERLGCTAYGTGEGDVPNVNEDYTTPVEDGGLFWQCSRSDEICCVQPEYHVTYREYIDSSPSGGTGILHVITDTIRPNHAYAIAVASPFDDKWCPWCKDGAAIGAVGGAIAGGVLVALTIGTGGIAGIVFLGALAVGAYTGYQITDTSLTMVQSILASIFEADHNSLIIGELKTVQSMCETEFGAEET